jgi:hypothetical protein
LTQNGGVLVITTGVEIFVLRRVVVVVVILIIIDICAGLLTC